MAKKVPSNHISIIAIACALGLTACAMEADEQDASDKESPSEDYGTVAQPLEIVNDTLPTSGTKTVSIASYPGEETMVIMRSPSAGTWTFTINGSPIGWDGCYTGDHGVFTYWKNGINDTWHYWPGGGGICWPTSPWSTNLASGSSSISYKFEIENFVGYPDRPYGQTVYLHFTKSSSSW